MGHLTLEEATSAYELETPPDERTRKEIKLIHFKLEQATSFLRECVSDSMTDLPQNKDFSELNYQVII
jgi:hypothetical protein